MEIRTKAELKSVLDEERRLYVSYSKRKRIIHAVQDRLSLKIWRFQKTLRYCEYLQTRKGKLASLRLYLCERKLYRRGAALGLEIYPGSVGRGLRIYHTGIVINNKVHIGDRCMLHGGNCIGNNGTEKQAVPVIGDDVDIGYGAGIYGKVALGDRVKIGAGAVVVKSCGNDATLVGIPAKEINTN